MKHSRIWLGAALLVALIALAATTLPWRRIPDAAQEEEPERAALPAATLEVGDLEQQLAKLEGPDTETSTRPATSPLASAPPTPLPSADMHAPA